MLFYYGQVVMLLLALMSFIARSENLSPKTNPIGKRWAVLVSGSNSYENYRHQADICHAYQILKKGGLKDENIIVFMYDDIAFNPENPRPGIIINKPSGDDVYYGVPKDYTGDNATADNFLAVLLGNESGLSGGSGKVLKSGPNDHVFVYYADHGSPGLVGMPSGDPLYAKDLIKALKKMHTQKTYKRLVFYMEACESGSMFEGLLPNNWNIYAVTAANAEESSYAAYCPDYFPPPPPEFDTCLGDVFSISWLEDSDVHDMSKETVGKQYSVVKRRTGNDDVNIGSHVMEYGSLELRKDFLSFYIGTDPFNQNFTAFSDDYSPPERSSVKQVDADLIPYKRKIYKTMEGSEERNKAVKKLDDILAHRRLVDGSINQIVKILFGEKNGPEIMNFVRPSGKPLVDDWDCFKILMRVYEKECGISSWYGKKYSRVIANMCNSGISVAQMIVAAKQACLKLE